MFCYLHIATSQVLPKSDYVIRVVKWIGYGIYMELKQKFASWIKTEINLIDNYMMPITYCLGVLNEVRI